MDVTLDFSNYPVIDNHCHPFRPDKETQSYEKYWILSALDMSSEDLKRSLLYQMVLEELKRYYDMPQATPGEIVGKRTEMYRKDPRAHVSSMFKHGNLECLVLDIGYPTVEFSGYPVDLKEFQAMMPGVRNKRMIRIEVLIERLLQQELSFDEMVRRFRDDVDLEVEENRAIALKSAIAYDTGLEIKIVDRAAAEKGYEAFMRDGDKGAETLMRNYLFCESLELCRAYSIPMQIHTGWGDSPTFDLRTGNPLLMLDVLSADRYRDLDIILVHAGYPYTSEAASLAHNYPNVWVDLSQMIPFAGVGIETHFRLLLELAPVTRIMYGSDGYNIPEMFWFSAVYFKKVLNKVFNDLVYAGTVNAGYAKQAARLILSENAKRVYQLEHEE